MVSFAIEQSIGFQLLLCMALLMKLVNLCLEDSRTLLSYNVSKVREQASVLRCVCKVAQHMEGVEKMSSCEDFVVNELANGC